MTQQVSDSASTERAVCTSIMFGGSPYYARYASARLSGEDFHDERWGRCFTWLVDFVREHGHVEPTAAAGPMFDAAREGGWTDLLPEFADQDDNPGLIHLYVDEVAEDAHVKRVRDAAEQMTQNPDRARDVAERLLEQPSRIGEPIMAPGDMLSGLERVYEQGQSRGVSTGWKTLDRFYTVKKGENTIVTGIPSHGKSTWLDALLINLAEQHGWKTLVWSPENWPFEEEHLPRLLQRWKRMPFHDGPNQRMSMHDVVEGTAWLEDHFRWLDTSTVRETRDLFDAAERHQRSRPFDTLVIDPFTELQRPGSTRMHDFVYDMLTEVDRFVQKHDVHIFVVAHPRKPQPDHKGPPSVYDIAESSHWANRADTVLAVHRTDVNQVMIDVQKVRHRTTGKPGEVKLDWNPVDYRFYERTAA